MGQLAMAGATSRASALMRPPYSSTPDAVTSADLRAIRQAAHSGYVVVLADQDSKDWTRPGWVAIVANSLPANGAGAIVMLHDGGGDRSQTVAALKIVLPRLLDEGFRFRQA